MSKLQQRIMRRVYFIWGLRAATGPTALRLFVALICLWQVGDQVFVSKVFANAANSADVVSRLSFFQSAFMNTELNVQLLSLGVLVFGLWFGYSFISASLRGRGSLQPVA